MDFKNKEEFLREFPGYMKEMTLKIPENLARLMGDVITVLLNRLEVPAEQIRETTDLVSKKGVNRMFDHVVESYFEGKRLAREEGVQIGREEGVLIGTEKGREEEREEAYREKLEIARRLLLKGWGAVETAETVGLDAEAVRRLVV
jgi:hypothetical protein